MDIFSIFVIYITLVSIVSILAVAIDKLNAKKGRRRISEKALFFLAFIGGSAFMYLAMSFFHHKTQKNSFVFLIPLIFAVQLLILCHYCNIVLP